MIRVRATLWVVIFLSAATSRAEAVQNSAQTRQQFIQRFCIDCHGPRKQENDFRLDHLAYNLADSDLRDQWDLVLKYVESRDMPPKAARRQPTTQQRGSFVQSLRADMVSIDQTAPVGGTSLRRLNRQEYLNTLQDLLEIRGFKLPNSFPNDSSDLPFDTMPDGLYLSAAVVDAYLETATNAADQLVPLPNPPQVVKGTDAANIGVDGARKWTRRGDSAVYLTGSNISPWSGGIWVPDFKAHMPGMYRVRMLASAEGRTGADQKPLRFSFHLSNANDYEIPRRALNSKHPAVAFLEVPNTETKWVECLVPVEKGESIYAFCDNRFSEPAPAFATKRELNFHVNRAKESDAPTLRVEAMEVLGPEAPLPRQISFLRKQAPQATPEYLRKVLVPFAELAFRRPLTAREADQIVEKSLAHISGRDLDPAYALHYGVRRILTSTPFLYLEAAEGRLSDYALASRLSYFLWSAPPDQELLRLASQQQLVDADQLRAQVFRMIADPRSEQFVKHFAGQWLENRRTQNLMVCDVRFQWSEMIRYGFVRSTELFFGEILRQNLPIRTFIDSEFIYANEPMLEAWGLPVETSISRHEANHRHYMMYPEPRKIALSSLDHRDPLRLGTRGGILGLPSVLAATGDGVESSPILRGVWILENVFGTPPPPPPANVPAIDVDISDANTLHEILAAHKENESCNQCHRKIDPIGLAMENYDAIGGWRTDYRAVYRAPNNSSSSIADNQSVTGHQPVEARGVLPDGTKLSGPADLKAYLLSNRALFTRCLTTKLFEYGAGREPSVGDRRVIEEIVSAEPPSGFGFAELIVRLVQSDAFLTK